MFYFFFFFFFASLPPQNYWTTDCFFLYILHCFWWLRHYIFFLNTHMYKYVCVCVHVSSFSKFFGSLGTREGMSLCCCRRPVFWGTGEQSGMWALKKSSSSQSCKKETRKKKKEKGLARTPFVGAVQNREKMKVRTFLILISFFLIILWLDWFVLEKSREREKKKKKGAKEEIGNWWGRQSSMDEFLHSFWMMVFLVQIWNVLLH